MSQLSRFFARRETYLRHLREIETSNIEYDIRSDEVYLAPGVPLTAAHIQIVMQRPYLADNWPPHIRARIGLLPLPDDYDDFMDRFW